MIHEIDVEEGHLPQQVFLKDVTFFRGVTSLPARRNSTEVKTAVGRVLCFWKVRRGPELEPGCTEKERIKDGSVYSLLSLSSPPSRRPRQV